MTSGGWIVVRLKPAQRLQLAGQRRVWVLGPSADGRVLVLLPGSVTGVIGRVRPEAAPESAELPALSRAVSMPGEDPVRLARYTGDRPAGWGERLESLLSGAICVWILLDGLGEIVTGLGSARVDVLIVIVLVVAVVLVLGRPWAARRPDGPWTELEVLVTEVKLRTPTTAKVVGSATLPDGTQLTVDLPAAEVDLAATGRLWLIGPAIPDTTVDVGLPGYPFHSTATLTP